MLPTKDLSEAKQALLAKYMRGEQRTPAKQTDIISRRAETGAAPLSFQQQYVWQLAQVMPDRPVYTECVTIHLPGPLDVPALEKSYNEIVRRHESWRTSFPLVDGQPVQQVHPPEWLTLPLIDLRNLPEAEREAEAARLTVEEAQRPFGLARGPLQRAMLVRREDEQHHLCLALHHIIFDCFSLYHVLLPELRSLYEAYLNGESSPLAELPIQYSDVALWQRQRMQGSVLEEQLQYWKTHLADAPEPATFSADHLRPARPTYRGAIQRVTLAEKLTTGLREMSRREGATLYSTMLAAFNTLLHRYSGQDDVLIRADSAGRNRAEFQHMLGVFINMLVLRTAITDNLSFRDLLRREQQQVLETQSYQDVPFEYLVQVLQAGRMVQQAQQQPLFPVALTFEPPAVALPSGWSLTHVAASADTPTFDLSLVIEDRRDYLICHFQYNTDLFEAITIEGMIAYWQALLESVVNDPAQTVRRDDGRPQGATPPPSLSPVPTMTTAGNSSLQVAVSPYLPVHFQLVRLWEELLGVRPVGIGDNFFFLGGHSLLATRLVAHIEQDFGKQISLATLFTHPTIESLAKVLLRKEDVQPATPLVTVQAEGTKRPFFYLHGDFKNGAFYCLSLARDLGNDQPFYALEPPAMNGSPFLASVEEMAAMNIEYMRTVQAEGPYLIGGFCNGALIACEMARQLRSQGEPVGLALLIDPMVVGDHRKIKRMIQATGKLLHRSQQSQLYWFLWLRHAYKYLLHGYRMIKYPHYRGLQAELNAEQVQAEGSVVAALKSLFELQCEYGLCGKNGQKRSAMDGLRWSVLKQGVLKQAPTGNMVFPDAVFPTFEKLSCDWEGMFLWSSADYRPGRYDGTSTFFFFQDGKRRQKQWQREAEAKDREVEMYVLAGTHESCKNEHLHELTRQIRLCLNKAEQNDGQDL